MTNYTHELAKLIDPKDPTKSDLKAIVHLAKEKLKGTSIEQGLVGHRDTTLYMVLKTQPISSLMQVLMEELNGPITSEFVAHILDKPKDCDFKRREDRFFGGEQWPVRGEACLKELYELIESGAVLSDEVPVVEQGTASGQPLSEQLAQTKDLLERSEAMLEDQETKTKGLTTKLAKKTKDFKAALKGLSDSVTVKAYDGLTVGVGELTGTTKLTPIKELFNGIVKSSSIKVPVWTWRDSEGQVVHNPKVPFIDENYLFRPQEVSRICYALLTNQRMYLHGHTGTGKTTLIEQVMAHLGWQVERMNFDSEITRMDMVGKVDLVSVDGASVTQWQDGILPAAMSSPTVLICDEFDFIRPDVSYVMQSALEGNGMTLLEDNGRKVYPHEMFRVFATGNTVGQGDEYGMYQGARAQSLALLDRFTVWQKVDYLPEKDRKALIKKTCVTLSDEALDIISSYTTEHLTAFTKSKILQPISPRGMLSIAKAVEYLELHGNPKGTDKITSKNIKEALDMVVLDKATQEDYAVLKGIVNRVVK